MDTLGCYTCIDSIMAWDEVNRAFGISAPQLPGYIGIEYWDADGSYLCIGRCYDCNHRDR